MVVRYQIYYFAGPAYAIGGLLCKYLKFSNPAKLYFSAPL
jgi:hypothetical protein